MLEFPKNWLGFVFYKCIQWNFDKYNQHNITGCHHKKGTSGLDNVEESACIDSTKW